MVFSICAATISDCSSKFRLFVCETTLCLEENLIVSMFGIYPKQSTFASAHASRKQAKWLEEDTLLKTTPAVGSFVKTPEGKGVVSDVNLLRGILKVAIGKDEDKVIKTFNVDEITILKSAEIKVSAEELKNLKELE